MAVINCTYTPEFLADRLQEVLDQAGDVSGLLDSMARCYGRDLAEQAYNVLCSRLPGVVTPHETLQVAHGYPRPGDAQWSAYLAEAALYPLYKLFDDGQIGERKGGVYRFYCYVSSWPISPAARRGYVLEGV